MKQLPEPSTRSPQTGPEGGPAASDLLSRALRLVDHIDRKHAELVDVTTDLLLTGEAEQRTGLPLDTFLSATGRMTGSDRRMLQVAAETLCQLPNTRRLFDTRTLSWSQVRAIICAAIKAKLAGQAWEAADQMIAALAHDCAACEPDELVRRFDRWLWQRLEAADVERDERAAARGRYLAIQPQLDGTAGRFWGQTDAVGLALLDGRTAPRPDQLDDEDELTPIGRVGRARHDNLMAALTGCAGASASRPAAEAWPGLIADTAAEHTTGPAGRPTLLLTATLEQLLDTGSHTTQLLTTLTGGRLRVSTTTARQLLHEGFDTRLTILDDVGQVIGVGHKTRIPPGWLRDALAVRDRSCTHPGCQRAGLTCQADHAQPWPAGPTDADNLALVCGPHNRSKEPDGWKVTGHPDGTRTWHHPRAGLTIRTLPHTRPLPQPRASPDPPT
ncbi:MAG TPA: DUF222 domain-containing protein [Nitriliruptorales bacterium]